MLNLFIYEQTDSFENKPLFELCEYLLICIIVMFLLLMEISLVGFRKKSGISVLVLV